MINIVINGEKRRIWRTTSHGVSFYPKSRLLFPFYRTLEFLFSITLKRSSRNTGNCVDYVSKSGGGDILVDY